MAKHKEVKVDPSIFRVMIEKFPLRYMSVDFTTKEEALQYTQDLTSDSTSWYGIYELNPKLPYLITIHHERLRPYDDIRPVKPKEDADKPKRKSTRKVKQSNVD